MYQTLFYKLQKKLVIYTKYCTVLCVQYILYFISVNCHGAAMIGVVSLLFIKLSKRK